MCARVCRTESVQASTSAWKVEHQEERASGFFTQGLKNYAIPLADAVHSSTVAGKGDYVHFIQRHAGLAVFGSHAMVKFDEQGRVIAFTADNGFPEDAFP